MSCLHPAARADDDPLGPPLGAEAFRLEEATTAALAAIMSRYEDARARIIAAPSPPSADDAGAAAEAVPPRWAPTVPVDLGSGLPCPQRDQGGRPGRPSVASAGEPPRRRHGRLRALLSRTVRAGGR